MSVYSNPPAGAARDPQQYIRAILDLLGDADPFSVLDETAGAIIAEITDVDDARLRRPEAEGKWSALQVLQHLADTELVYTNRYRWAVAQDGLTIVGFDQEAWARNLWRGDEAISEVLEQFVGARTVNLRFLRRLNDEERERAIMHPERGRESVNHLLKMHAGHDLVHRKQLTRVLGAK